MSNDLKYFEVYNPTDEPIKFGPYIVYGKTALQFQEYQRAEILQLIDNTPLEIREIVEGFD